MKEPVTDWKRNAIKENDEICIIEVNTIGAGEGIAFMPDGKGNFITHKMPEIKSESCWNVGEYSLAKNIPNLDIVKLWMTDNYILAIKGKSDNMEDYFETIK